MREKAFSPPTPGNDEARNFYSHARGDHFLDHFFLNSLRAGEDFAGSGKDEQEIRSQFGGFVFNAANGYGICFGTRGTAPARGKVSVEEGNCDDRFLDR